MSILERFREHPQKRFFTVVIIVLGLVALIVLQRTLFTQGSSEKPEASSGGVTAVEAVPEHVGDYPMPISKAVQDSILVKQNKILDVIKQGGDVGEQIYALENELAPNILASQDSDLPLGLNIDDATPKAFKVLHPQIVELIVASKNQGWVFTWNNLNVWKVVDVKKIALPLPSMFPTDATVLPIPVSEESLSGVVQTSINVANVLSLTGLEDSAKNALLVPFVESKIINASVDDNAPTLDVPQVSEFKKVERISASAVETIVESPTGQFTIRFHNHGKGWKVGGVIDATCKDACSLLADVHDPHNHKAHGN